MTPIFINGNWYKQDSNGWCWLHLSPIVTLWLQAIKPEGETTNDKWEESILHKFHNFIK